MIGIVELSFFIGMVAPAAGVTAYVHRTFSSKKDVLEQVVHLKEVRALQDQNILDKLDQLHRDLEDLKEIVKERL